MARKTKVAPKEKAHIGRPRYNPSDSDRMMVRMMTGYGYSHQRLANFLGISRKTFDIVFSVECANGGTDVDINCMTALTQQIKNGNTRAIEIHMYQKMWREDRGGWRARPTEFAMGQSQSVADGGSGLAPLVIKVAFRDADPSKKPKDIP